MEFWGGSFLADPFGRVIAKASHDKEEILLGEIDLGLMEETRRNWPFLRDRRIDAYAPITQALSRSGEAWRAGGDGEQQRRPCAEATPRELGYRMPAEWEPHEATWLAWPHNPEDWPGKFQPFPGSMRRSCACLRRASACTFWSTDAKAERRATAFWSARAQISTA